MKQIFRFLILSFLSVSCFAKPVKKIFTIDNKPISFIILPEIPITVSENCVLYDKLKNCMASSAITKVNVSSLSIKSTGTNPGARLCTEQLSGKVVWSVDAVGNEKTFCKFNDETFVATASLFIHGRKK